MYKSYTVTIRYTRPSLLSNICSTLHIHTSATHSSSRFEPESDNFSSGRNSLRKVDGAGGSVGSLSSIGASSTGDLDENQSSDPQVLNQQLKEMKDERDRLQKRCEQVGGWSLNVRSCDSDQSYGLKY